MNGAQSLVHAFVDGGVDVCFTNPGTSEMHFVAALDQIAGMRCVLGLFEGVVTGAADGYYRMTDRPAATLLHLGPGLANGLANLHNAKKAQSGVVNIVGDHALTHMALDAPLTSDIAGLAAPMSHWVRSASSSDTVAEDGRAAIVQARARPGQIATLILPADTAWTQRQKPWLAQGPVMEAPAAARPDAAIEFASGILRAHGASTLLLLGGRALRAESTSWAGRIMAATGCAVMSEFYGARIERGAGRVAVPRLPYAVDAALAVLQRFTHIVLVGAREPVAFFAYPDKPGRLSPPGCQVWQMTQPVDDQAGALEALADSLGARARPYSAVLPAPAAAGLAQGSLTPDAIGLLLGALIPENAIVIDEAVSTGRRFDQATCNAAPHDWLTNMGGSIGFGLPVAIGAAIGAPGRKVIALEGDGSAMYTPQALWTMARENLDITVLIFANHAYQILRGEFAGVGAGPLGQRATDMLTLDRPCLDWLSIGRGMGVPCARVHDLSSLAAEMRRALAGEGPHLIEVMM